MPISELPFVTVVVPTLNEQRHILDCLNSLMAGAARIDCEIFVVDGGSADQTVEIVAAFARAVDAKVLVINNPKRLQAAAMNLGASRAAPYSRVLVRADAHARYPVDFIDTCVRALTSTGATSVVVPMVTEGKTAMQRAIAAAQNSRLGNGGSAHRIGGKSRFVDHGHHAAFDLAFFRAVGGYNEGFSHNEDAELDIRQLRAGGKIWMCCESSIVYFPRNSISSVAIQYFKHGRGRARTLLLHGMRPRLRQMAPLAILLSCAGGMLSGVFDHRFFALPLAYVLICQFWAAAASVRLSDPALLAMGNAAIAMHLSWATGFLWTFAKLFLHRCRSVAAMPFKYLPHVKV
jgi:succinoglycan biosynthesis protein ExoA